MKRQLAGEWSGARRASTVWLVGHRLGAAKCERRALIDLDVGPGVAQEGH